LAELATEPAWLEARRRRGAELTESLPLPDHKTKGWDFTDLSKLDLDSYAAADAAVEVSGGGGATVVSLAEAVESHAELVEAALGSLVSAEDPFVARNEAAWRDGVLVHVPRGVKLEEPVRIEVPVSEGGTAISWRTLIVLEEGAEAEVWEHWSSPDDEVDALLNSVVELSVGQAATLRYVNTQDLSEKTWIFASQRAQVERDVGLALQRRAGGLDQGKNRSLESAKGGWTNRATGRAREKSKRDTGYNPRPKENRVPSQKIPK